MTSQRSTSTHPKSSPRRWRRRVRRALDDVDVFKQTMETFSGSNPFLEEPTALRFVGRTFYEQPRQVSVPVVVQYVEGGEYKPLFVAQLPD